MDEYKASTVSSLQRPLPFHTVLSDSIGKYESASRQSCPTLCHPMDCSPPGCSVHGTVQARILEWVAFPFSKESSRLRDRTQVSCIADGLYCLSHQRSPYLKIRASIKSYKYCPLVAQKCYQGFLPNYSNCIIQYCVLKISEFSSFKSYTRFIPVT